jgi:hypothetical protein
MRNVGGQDKGKWLEKGRWIGEREGVRRKGGG